LLKDVNLNKKYFFDFCFVEIKKILHLPTLSGK
jgi:hypothetical protein